VRTSHSSRPTPMTSAAVPKAEMAMIDSTGPRCVGILVVKTIYAGVKRDQPSTHTLYTPPMSTLAVGSCTVRGAEVEVDISPPLSVPGVSGVRDPVSSCRCPGHQIPLSRAVPRFPAEVPARPNDLPLTGAFVHAGECGRLCRRHQHRAARPFRRGPGAGVLFAGSAGVTGLASLEARIRRPRCSCWAGRFSLPPAERWSTSSGGPGSGEP
jgi:hypothetical protein